MLVYKKFCYWTDLHGLRKVRKDLEERGIQLTDETRIPCRMLRSSRDIGYLSPPAWDGFCKRRTSWYQRSDKGGKSIVVSNTSLDHLDIGNPIIISDSDFKSNRLPSSEEIVQLVKSQEFQKRKSPVWEKIDPLEKEFYQRWLGRNRANEPFDFDKILLSHSANHANFLDPKYFVNLNGMKVPYSIADSSHVCSSCLEFFNILGEQWTVKYVVPCIGAVQFVHLPINEYFKVMVK